MKKLAAALFLLLVVLLVAAETLGQTVGASQIKTKADGGLKADTANALAVGLKRGVTAPASPVSGQLWLDTSTTPATLKTYNGATWEIPPNGSVSILSDLSSLPGSPTNGQIVWISGLKRAIVYDSSDSSWYYLDGTNRKATSTYDLSANLSTATISSPGSAPTVATGTGTSTAGTHVCAVTFLSSTGGETTPGPASTAVTTTGAQGIAVSNIPTGGAGVVGRRVYCSKAGTISPLFLAGTLADNTTTTLTVGTATDAAFTNAAPDTNFSAPIPSGWTFRAPNSNDLTYGGCGSTGTSLICVAYAYTAAATTSTNGVRLTYGVTDGSGNWNVTFRVTRARAGFNGTGTLLDHSMIWLIAASANNVDAPEARGVGAYSTTSTLYDEWTDFSSVNKFTRAVGGAWSNSSAQPGSLYRWAYVIPSLWFRCLSTSTYSHRWETSTDAKNWNALAVDTPSPAVYLTNVGIALERGTSSTSAGQVIEIDSLTVEPW